jgi:sec-independent protein translocase protein TatA
MGIGWTEALIIILILVVLFGARRIPELAKGLGEGIRNFKSGMRGDEQKEIEDRKYSERIENREGTHRSA